MVRRRQTHDIPFSEKGITDVLYNTRKSSFVSPEEILRKTSFETDYSKERPGVDYTSLGTPKPLNRD